MKILDLPVETRDRLGSGNARRYRRAGKIPCHLYGRGQPNVNLVAAVKDVETMLKAHTALVTLKLGAKEQMALLRDVAWDTFSEHVDHIDFTRVELTDEVEIKVPVHLAGVPAGASQGGETVLVKPDLQVFARVDSIPSEIRIDVSHLEIDMAVHVGEVTYPPNVRPALDVREVVVVLQPPKKVEVPVAAVPAEGAEIASAEGAAPTEPVRVGDEKREEKRKEKEQEQEKGKGKAKK
jgi:large subunit ribosomal protein L25